MPGFRKRPARTGALFLIGGAADTCMADFVRIAGGAEKHFVVITHASTIPRQRGNDVSAQLSACGVKRITVITPRSREQKLPQDVDAIFIAGGDQKRLVRLLEASGLPEDIRQEHRAGTVIGGTSAGAACVSSLMIAGGKAGTHTTPDCAQIAAGLMLLPNVVIDTHFGERKREHRMRAALATTDLRYAIGLDEDTAVLIRDKSVEVFGSGSAWFFERETNHVIWADRAATAMLRKFTSGETFRCD